MQSLNVRALGAFFVATLLFLILDWVGLTRPLVSLTQLATVPVQFGAHSLRNGVVDTFSVVTFWRSGELRIKSLEERNAELTAASERVKALENENTELRKQLGQPGAIVTRFIPARVVGVGTELVIDKGSNDGIKVGQSATYLNNVVGKVVKVTPRVSYVELPTDGVSKISCRIREAHCLAVGQFHSTIAFDRVAQNEEVVVGDVIVTSGEDGAFPAGLVIGKVVSITSKETDLFVSGEIEPLINYSSLTTVFLTLN